MAIRQQDPRRSRRPSPTPPRVFIDPHAAAAVTGFSVGVLANQRARGEGPPYVRVGRAIRYDQAALIDWMDSHAVTTGGAA